MYLTDLRVSALALFCSVALVLGASHYANAAAESCAACVEVESVSNASSVQAEAPALQRAKVATPSGSMC